MRYHDRAVSITRRILEGAQSGLSRLTSLVIVDDEPLSHVESSALAAELTIRKAARDQAGRPASDNPLAKLASSDPAARATRARAAAERAARVHKDRDDREARVKAESDAQLRRLREEAARAGRNTASTSGGVGGSSGSSAGSARSTSSSSSSSGRPPRPGSAEANVAEWLRVLDLSAGAGLPQIKTAYRQMMRKYHPDMHASSPQKQKAATELSVRVTAAYNGLVSYLNKK